MTAITTTPIVFVVDHDVALRESVKSLVQASRWRAETFASAQALVARPSIAAWLGGGPRLPALSLAS